RRMTGGARRREPRRCVIRIVRSLVVHLVAQVAIDRRSLVHVAYVATRAGGRGVLSSEWEGSLIVIECRPSPRRRCMADGAICWKSSLRVVGAGSPCVVLLMARITSGG